MDNFELIEFDVTCHTAGCENSEITIRVNAIPDTPNVVCGPCGVKIEDLSTVLEDDL